MFNPGIQPGAVLTNAELSTLFKCSTQGGMRRSRTTNSLLIISNHVESIYNDRWIDDVFHYTGMGLEGDQRLDFMQNRTLAESESSGVDVYLFEVFKPNQYTFTGKAALAKKPYQEQQPDHKGKNRYVWIFPLRLLHGAQVPISEKQFQEHNKRKEREAHKLSDEELAKRVAYSVKKPGTRTISSSQYERNPWIIEFAKRRAQGYCQLCSQPAPFTDSTGVPFLETHHIIWLSKGGEDSIENTVALCPNCHRKMHILDCRKDKLKLSQIAVPR